MKLIALRVVLSLCGLAALGTIVFVGLGAITGGPRVSHQVVASVTAPGGRLKAVLTRIGGSEASDFGYVVDVVSTMTDSDMARVANAHAAKDNGAAVLDMVWANSRSLELDIPRGTIVQLEPGDATVGGQPVTAMLKPR